MVFVIWDVMYVFNTVYIDAIDESLWDDSPMVFTSVAVTSDNRWRPKIVIHNKPSIISFLNRSYLA